MWFIQGMIAWMATGLDDIAIVYLLTSEQNKFGKIAILIGTLLGTIIMFGIAYLLSYFVSNILGPSPYYRLAGLIPVLFGLSAIKKTWSGENEESTSKRHQKKFISLLLLACGLYLSNTTDDIFVNTTLILDGLRQENSLLPIFYLLIGNLTGAIIFSTIGIYIRTLMSPKIEKVANTFAGLILVCIGIMILTS